MLAFFSDTRAHALRIEYIQRGRVAGSGLVFEWSPRHELLQDEAVETAKKADVVVAFVGLTARLKGEEMRVNAKGFSGGDRTDIDLPDVQQELLEAVAKTGKPLVVVMLNGSALAVNWAQQNAKAILKPGIRVKQAGKPSQRRSVAGTILPAGSLSPFIPASTSCPLSKTTRWPTAPIVTSRASRSSPSETGSATRHSRIQT